MPLFCTFLFLPSSWTLPFGSSSPTPPKSNNMDHKHNNNCSTKRTSISILAISLPLLYASLMHIPLSSLFMDTTFWFLISNSIIVVVVADSGIFSSSSSSEDLYDEYIKHSGRSYKQATSYRDPYYSGWVKEDKEYLPRVERLNLKDGEPRNITVVLKDDESQPEESLNSHEEELRSISAADLIISVQFDPANSDQVASRKCYYTTPKGEESCSVKSLNLREEEAHDVSTPENENETTVSKQLVKCQRSRSELTIEKRHAKDLIRRSKTGKENKSCGMEESEYWKMSDEELNRRVEEFIWRFNREIRLQDRMCTSVC